MRFRHFKHCLLMAMAGPMKGSTARRRGRERMHGRRARRQRRRGPSAQARREAAQRRSIPPSSSASSAIGTSWRPARARECGTRTGFSSRCSRAANGTTRSCTTPTPTRVAALRDTRCRTQSRDRYAPAAAGLALWRGRAREVSVRHGGASGRACTGPHLQESPCQGLGEVLA